MDTEASRTTQTTVGPEQGMGRLADIRYKGGVSSYLEVLDSERQAFDAELGLVRAQRDELLAVVRLYRALDGGWQEEPTPTKAN